MSWDELVTTALLGTDRRPALPEMPAWAYGARSETDAVPRGVAAAQLLSVAARYRCVRRAIRELPTAPAPPAPPRDERPSAPASAQRLLGELLTGPARPELVDIWLRAAVAEGVTLAAEDWVPVIELAGRSRALDRGTLAAALGPTGLWFVNQNPAWAAVARHLEAASAAEPVAEVVPLTSAQLAAEPEQALTPGLVWTRDLVLTLLALLGRDGRGAGGVRYAYAVGARLPEEQLALVRAAAEHYSEAARTLPPAVQRHVRLAFAALVEAVSTSAEIRRAFVVLAPADQASS